MLVALFGSTSISGLVVKIAHPLNRELKSKFIKLI